MVTSSETIVRTKIFQVAAKLLRSRHGGTRLYRSFSIAGGGAPLVWASDRTIKTTRAKPTRAKYRQFFVKNVMKYLSGF